MKTNNYHPLKGAKIKNMNKALIVLIILLGLAGSWVGLRFITSKEPVVCTMDAKECPDGSYVGRVAPNCEFAECPSGNSELSSNFDNNQVEKAVTDYLLTQKRFSWKNRDDGINLCAIENLNPESEMFPLYVWAYCGEYVLENGELKKVGASSMPVKINYPNELSFYRLDKFSYEAPGDGSQYTEDVKKIFPEDVWQRIFHFDRKNIIKRIEVSALANIQSWESIKQVINNCEVKSVWQGHDRRAGAKLKNGQELTSFEPKLDDIIDLAVAAEPKCGKILMATE